MASFCSRVDGDSQHEFLAKLFLLKISRDSIILCEICKDDKKDIRMRSVTSVWCLCY